MIEKNDCEINCGLCRHWKMTQKFESVPDTGECSGMTQNGRIVIDVYAGWEGGYVSSIETDEDFFCAEFKK